MLRLLREARFDDFEDLEDRDRLEETAFFLERLLDLDERLALRLGARFMERAAEGEMTAASEGMSRAVGPARKAKAETRDSGIVSALLPLSFKGIPRSSQNFEKGL